ncbi:MAG: hypothetical protein HY717_15655 [Planctomycetes bacterium]|nr:hypothetical protein [Planctomycetota bacterium]
MTAGKGKAAAWACGAAGLLIALVAMVAFFPYPSVQVAILSEKKIYRPGETIKGKYIIRNLRFEPLILSQWELPKIEPVDAGNRIPPNFPARTFICGFLRANSPPIHIDAFESFEGSFQIDTDPLADLGGFDLIEGVYRLTCLHFLEKRSGRIHITNAPIQVRSASRQKLEDRIIHFAAGGSRLVALRQDGRIESFDVSSGEQRGSIQIPAFNLRYFKRGGYLSISPEARLGAVLKGNSGSGSIQRHQVEMIELEGSNAQPKIFKIPPKTLEEIGDCRLQGFDASAKKIILDRIVEVLQIDCSSSEISTKNTPPNSILSTDGRYLIHWENESGEEIPLVSPMKGGAPLRVQTPGPPSSCSHHLGRRGIYLGCEKSGKAIFQSYDGAVRKAFKTKGYPICESPDGQWIAFKTDSEYDYFEKRAPGSLEVWEIKSSRKLFEIQDDQHREAAFASTPCWLICAVVRLGNAYPAFWYDDRFEAYDPETGRLVKTLALEPR